MAQGVDPGDFSLDGLSRIEVPSKFHAADLIDMTGGNIHIAHGRLGLPDEPVATDLDIDAFSYGKDKLAPFGPRFFVSLEYSVSRGSLGGRASNRRGDPSETATAMPETSFVCTGSLTGTSSAPGRIRTRRTSG